MQFGKHRSKGDEVDNIYAIYGRIYLEKYTNLSSKGKLAKLEA